MKLHKEALLEKACSKDPSRHVLHNPYIDRSEPGSPVIVATTGAIMAVVPVTELADGEHGFLPVSVMKAARKVKNGATDHCSIEFGGENSRTFRLGNGAVLPDDISEWGNFPQWRQIMPRADREVTMRVSLNPTLLLALAEAMAAGDGVTLEIKDATSPVVVKPSFHSGSGNRAKAPLIPDAIGILCTIMQPDADEPKAKTSAGAPAYAAK